MLLKFSYTKSVPLLHILITYFFLFFSFLWHWRLNQPCTFTLSFSLFSLHTLSLFLAHTHPILHMAQNSCGGRGHLLGVGSCFLQCDSQRSGLAVSTFTLFSLAHNISFYFYFHLSISLYSKTDIILVVWWRWGVECMCVCPFEDKGTQGVLLYSVCCSVETRSLTESRAKLVSSKPQWSSCLHPDKNWPYPVFYMEIWTKVFIPADPSP